MPEAQLDSAPRLVNPSVWAKEQAEELLEQNTPHVYIGIVLEDGNYTLELEEDCVNILSTYPTDTSDFDTAFQVAAEVEEVLTSKGIQVYRDAEAWEEFAESL